MTEARIRRIALILVVLCIAGASGLAYTGYRRDITQARERVATGSQVVQTPCGPIEYSAAGNGKPVLVVHGSRGGYDQGLDFAKSLIGGFRLIAMSRCGYLAPRCRATPPPPRRLMPALACSTHLGSATPRCSAPRREHPRRCSLR